MGVPNLIRIVSVSSDAVQLSLETSFFPGRPPEIHVVSIAPSEGYLFRQVLAAHPFGSSGGHCCFLESLSESAGMCRCSVRVTAEGSRNRQQFEIGASTYAELKRVIDSNIISADYVRE